MPSAVDRAGVETLVAGGGQLVEVLPKAEFDEEHLPDAIHLPLQHIDADARSALDAGRPVIVYCWDSL